VLFEFAGPVPSYTVRYVPEIVGPGQRAAVRLGGRAFLEVVFHPAATRDGGGFSAPRGSDSVGGTRALVQYCLAGDHAGYVSFGLGIDKRAPFRVMELSNPPRVAIDIAE